VLAEERQRRVPDRAQSVVETGVGVGSLVGRVGLKRPSLYKILSTDGNPTLETMREILKPLGLRVSVALNKAA
jgi:DNA-binding phage protein